MTKKILTLIYGTIAYLAFVLSFSYAILFIGNIWVKPSLDSIHNSDFLTALIIDAFLLGAFAIQHSVMARPVFKRWLTRVVPASIERSTYVLASSILLWLIVFAWQPLGGVIWQIHNPVLIGLIYSMFALGWCLVFISTFQINHFDLFGLRQVWLYFRGRTYTDLSFKVPLLYRYVRHPLYVGILIGIWAAPTMTVSHLIFAFLCTGYIFVGVQLEERDLEHALPEYREYKSQTPMFIPRLASEVIAKPVESA